jgi:hypothetical protein
MSISTKQLKTLTVSQMQEMDLPGNSDVEESFHKFMLFGDPKSGKSSFFAQNKNACFLPLCTGLKGIERKKIAPFGGSLINSYEELIMALQLVRHTRHDFNALVVDTVDGMVDLAIVPYVLETYCNSNWDDFSSWGKGWSAVATEVTKIVGALEEISEARKMHIAFVSHCQFANVNDPAFGKIDVARTSLPKTVWRILHGWVDNIFRVIKPTEKDKDGVPLNLPNQLYTKSLPTCVTGCREGYWLPEKIPMDWHNLLELLEGNKKENLLKKLETLLAEKPDKKKKVIEFLGTENFQVCDRSEIYNAIRKLGG